MSRNGIARQVAEKITPVRLCYVMLCYVMLCCCIVWYGKVRGVVGWGGIGLMVLLCIALFCLALDCNVSIVLHRISYYIVV